MEGGILFPLLGHTTEGPDNPRGNRSAVTQKLDRLFRIGGPSVNAARLVELRWIDRVYELTPREALHVNTRNPGKNEGDGPGSEETPHLQFRRFVARRSFNTSNQVMFIS